ncbi:MAG: zinc ribbon domain-containing protein [Pseudomonadota bacterium]
MMLQCPRCGFSVDQTDRYCRQCGTALVSGTGTPASTRVSPENAAAVWNNFFRPFFKTAFIFFACFFGFSLIMVVIWFFMFKR